MTVSHATPAVDLFQKYNVAGPRYTSYPTVPYWSENPTEAQWIETIGRALDESKDQGIGAALYIHIPFCESLCTYCGCNTRISRNHKVASPYVQTVLKEWKLYQERLQRKIKLTEIHLGGGTPTFLAAEELDTLMTGILEGVEVGENPEFSVEADPRVTRREHLEVLRKKGFTRLSLGIQDFDPAVQSIVNRVQTEQQVREVTEVARSLGYTSVNYDLIYGLPLQTLESVRNTVDVVRRLRPDRIAFYGYAHVPWIKASHRRFTEADLPSGDQKRKLYELGRELLEADGYREVGMDHFALETDSLWEASQSSTLHRNFMGYTSRLVAPLIALGVSAIGDSWWSFAQNEKLLETYEKRVAQGEIPIYRGHLLSSEDLVLRKHILNLMTQMHTHWSLPELRSPHLQGIRERLKEVEQDGLVELSGEGCRITEKGRPFIRNICMVFDARLLEKAPTTQLFSRTI